MNKQIQSALNWRYATKLFNADKKVSSEDLQVLLDAARLAPSSLGLSPWKMIVVTNPEVRAQLKAAAWGQSQISDASHLIIFAVRKTLNESYINEYLTVVKQTRGQKDEDVAGYKAMMMGSFAGKTDEQVKEWNARQAYIALGFLLETAALLQIDACPMEGFDPAQFDKILQIDSTDYATIVMAAVGYRSETDKYALAPKVRFDQKNIIDYI